MKIAVIELGSNSCKVLLAESHKSPKTLVESRIPCRIAAFLNTSGELSPEGVKLVLDTLAEANQLVQEAGQIYLLGTEALRRVAGIKALGKTIKINTGLELKVLSAEEEARLAFLGATAGQTLKGKIVFFDTGGLSTEVVFTQDDRIKRFQSFKLGAVALAGKYLTRMPMANSCFYGLEEHIAKIMKFKPPHNPILIGAGGVVTTCAAVALGLPEYDSQRLEGYYLSRMEVFRQIALYRSMSLDEIKAVPGMDASRADTILAGTMIILRIMDVLGVISLKVSARGVSYGYLATLK